jgi:hypothetical protein
MEEELQLAVVHRDLGDARRHREKPEREPTPASHEPRLAKVKDVRARVGAQVP